MYPALFLLYMKTLKFAITIFYFFSFQERTKNAQFIIISLRSNMFELADTLVGIYKTHNATKTATVNPIEYVNVNPIISRAAQDNEKVCTHRIG